RAYDEPVTPIVVEFSKREIESGVDRRPTRRRRAETGGGGTRALDDGDERTLAPSGVARIAVRAARQHPVQPRERRDLARTHANDRQRWRVQYRLDEVNGV